MLNIKDRLDDLYEEWLLEMYPDIIFTKDQLIEMFEEGYEYDEFIKEVKKNL